MKVPSGPSVTSPTDLDPNLRWLDADIYPDLGPYLHDLNLDCPPITLIWGYHLRDLNLGWLDAEIYLNLGP